MQISTQATSDLHMAGIFTDSQISLQRIDDVNRNSHTGASTTISLEYRVVIKTLGADDEIQWSRDIEAHGDQAAYRSCLAYFNRAAGADHQPMF